MLKPWSITTTIRNPERLKDILIVLTKLEGKSWNIESQKTFQTLLIKERFYGYGSVQFYKGLSAKQIKIIDNYTNEISFEEAQDIFKSKNYTDPAMRGRQSINPLKKLGFVIIDEGNIHITTLGRLFLDENYDLGEIFFRSFLKWQIPNPTTTDYRKEDGYDIKPFIGTLHLIDKINKHSKEINEKEKGISKQEFCLFAPTLINYKNIDKYARLIIKLRIQQKDKSKKEKKLIFDSFKLEFVKKYLKVKTKTEIDKTFKNLNDYGDNALRYFRLTRYFYIRGGGYYIDLEPRRKIELENLLSSDNGSSLDFLDIEDYLKYMSNISEPKLAWESKTQLKKIIKSLETEIKAYKTELDESNHLFINYSNFEEKQLKLYIPKLRDLRRELKNKEIQKKSQGIQALEKTIDILNNIFKLEDRPILLEKFSALGLNSLNDAIQIKPNYPVGDDNEPTFTAPANTPDIECYYKSYNAICEVTMLTGRNQWYNEGQPVMRHFRNFEDASKQKNNYCLFIAPSVHRDTLNTFWSSIMYEYEGQKQKIIPFTIKNFINLLEVQLELKKNRKYLKHHEISQLFDNILESVIRFSTSEEWLSSIPHELTKWKKSIFKVIKD